MRNLLHGTTDGAFVPYCCSRGEETIYGVGQGDPMSVDPAAVANRTPPAWLNELMILMLKTPGIQRLVGKSTALVTFTGRKSGRLYTYPLSYVEMDERIIVAGHRTRKWWRNLETDPKVQVRLAGQVRNGFATVMIDPNDALPDYIAYLEAQPMVARITEIPLDENGRADHDKAREVLGYTVVVSIKLEGESN